MSLVCRLKTELSGPQSTGRGRHWPRRPSNHTASGDTTTHCPVSIKATNSQLGASTQFGRVGARALLPTAASTKARVHCPSHRSRGDLVPVAHDRNEGPTLIEASEPDADDEWRRG